MVWPVALALTVAVPPAALTALVGQLGATGFRDRESASVRLLAAGPRAVAPLTAAAKGTDPEVRRRAAALLDRIEADRLGSPTLVTVHADRRPLAAVVADLGRQAGCPIDLSGPADRSPVVTLRRDRVPFWAALDAVCDVSGHALQLPDDGGRLALVPADTTDPFVSYAGPFRVAATGIHAGQSRQLAGVPRRGLPPAGPEPLHLSLTLSAEPKAPVVGVGQPVVHVADDDRGRSLKPAADEERASFYPPGVGHRALAHGFAVSLTRGDKAATTIRTLRGTVPVAVLAGTVPDAVLPDPLNAKGKTAKGRTGSLTLTSATVADGLLTLEVTIAAPAGTGGDGEPPDDWQSAAAQRLEVSGPDGTPWGFAGVASQTGAERAVTVGVQFKPPADGAKPARLTLVEWRAVTRDVAFEFRDVPLP